VDFSFYIGSANLRPSSSIPDSSYTLHPNPYTLASRYPLANASHAAPNNPASSPHSAFKI
jgi:hypothetical protein